MRLELYILGKITANFWCFTCLHIHAKRGERIKHKDTHLFLPGYVYFSYLLPLACSPLSLLKSKFYRERITWTALEMRDCVHPHGHAISSSAPTPHTHRLYSFIVFALPHPPPVDTMKWFSLWNMYLSSFSYSSYWTVALSYIFFLILMYLLLLTTLFRS